jgi:hypothetical protein
LSAHGSRGRRSARSHLFLKNIIWLYNNSMKATPLGPQWLSIDLQPYAGRYVALVEGRVAAVADTYAGAFARARTAHLRRMPIILKIKAPVTE